MKYVDRAILPQIEAALARGKSVLLLGARQTGKTTLINERLSPDITYSFAKLETKFRYEKNPVQFEKELSHQIEEMQKKPLVFIDEVQKIPVVMDAIQLLIDEKKAQFILSGSSARKLKHGTKINLLPGRLVTILMDPLIYSELPAACTELEKLLCYGSMPGVITEHDDNKEIDLKNYVMTYVEEEIREEALVRNIGAFSQFLELAAIESGNSVNFTKMSQDVGVSDQTIREYYQILEDCLIAFKLKPLTETTSRRNLLKAPKYLFFDLGVRRLAAQEGVRASIKTKANWFEQFVGLEILRHLHIYQPLYHLLYWRDTNSVEVDYVIHTSEEYIPIEVKWNDAPTEKDARHLMKFINEYANCKKGYIVCRTPAPYKIAHNMMVLSWRDIHKIFEK